MKKVLPAQETVVDGKKTVVAEHAIEMLCSNCGFDVDESELEADTCSDCGAGLELKQNIAIKVTTVPMSGATM